MEDQVDISQQLLQEERNSSFAPNQHMVQVSLAQHSTSYINVASAQTLAMRIMVLNTHSQFVTAKELEQNLGQTQCRWRQDQSTFAMQLYQHRSLVHDLFEYCYQPIGENPQLALEFRKTLYELFGKENYQHLKYQFLHVDYLLNANSFNIKPQLLACSAEALFEARRKMNLEASSGTFQVRQRQQGQQANVINPAFVNLEATRYNQPNTDIFRFGSSAVQEEESKTQRPLVKKQWKCTGPVENDLRFDVEGRRLLNTRNQPALIPGKVLWQSVPSRMTLSFLVGLLFDTAVEFDIKTKLTDKQEHDDQFYAAFWQSSHVTRFLSQGNLGSVFEALALLPHDATYSVQALYECLHFICGIQAPELCWQLEYLITGALLSNIEGRRMHYFAVKLLIHNFAILVKHRTPFKYSSPLPELEQLSYQRQYEVPQNVLNFMAPKHQFWKQDSNQLNASLKWLNFLSDATEITPIRIDEEADLMVIHQQLIGAFKAQAVQLNFDVKQFGRMLLRDTLNQPRNNSQQWKYEVGQLGYGSMLSSQSQFLGQMQIRQHKHFYLLTRYVVQCLNTGAMHGFRFKHLEYKYPPVMQYLYAQKQLTAWLYKWSRPDTQGYIDWYLQHVWQRQGKPRPKKASLLMDIKMLGSFTELEFVNQDSFILCTEVEQILLAKVQWSEFHADFKVFTPVCQANFSDPEREPEIAIVHNLITAATQIPCFIDVMLRRLLFRAWVWERTLQVPKPLQHQDWQEYTERRQRPIDDDPTHLSHFASDNIILSDQSIIGYQGMEISRDNVRQDASILEEEAQRITSAEHRQSSQIFATTIDTSRSVRSKGRANSNSRRTGAPQRNRTPQQRTQASLMVHNQPPSLQRVAVFNDDDVDMISANSGLQNYTDWFGQGMEAVAVAVQKDSKVKLEQEWRQLPVADKATVKLLVDKAMELRTAPDSERDDWTSCTQKAATLFEQLFFDLNHQALLQQQFEYDLNLPLPVAMLQGSFADERGWKLQMWLQQCRKACGDDVNIQMMMTFACQGIFKTFLAFRNLTFEEYKREALEEILGSQNSQTQATPFSNSNMQ